MGRPASPRTEQAMSGPDLAARSRRRRRIRVGATAVIIALAVATPAVCVAP
jgi:hypothetical protein